MNDSFKGTGRSTRQILLAIICINKLQRHGEYVTLDEQSALDLAEYTQGQLQSVGVTALFSSEPDGYRLSMVDGSLTFRSYIAEPVPDTFTVVDHRAAELVADADTARRRAAAVESVTALVQKFGINIGEL